MSETRYTANEWKDILMADNQRRADALEVLRELVDSAQVLLRSKTNVVIESRITVETWERAQKIAGGE